MRFASLLSVVLLLSGCAEGTTVYHNRSVNPERPRVITTDAKQRSVFLVPEDTSNGKEGEHAGQWRVCAEASPDVFSALSASASLEADIASKSGKAAAAIAESAATIERTQTINLLRESMYRTCERYLSGAISKETFIVQAARDQRAMVAVLAIEQLTGAIRRPSTVIAGPSTSSSLVNGDTVATLIEQYTTERTDAKKLRDDADTAYKESSKAPVGDCSGDKVLSAADQNDGAKSDGWAKCKADWATLAARQKDLDKADERLDEALKLTASVAGSSTRSETAQAGGGVAPELKDETIKQVAESVERIANQPGIDESLMFCIAYLGRNKDEQRPDVVTGCMDVVANRASLDNNRIRLNLWGYESAAQAGMHSARHYVSFKNELLARIGASTDATIAADVAKFEEKAGLKSPVRGKCNKIVTCREAVDDDDYASAYQKNGTKMDDALRFWATHPNPDPPVQR